MKLIHRLDELPANFRGGAVTIGNFDGVHLGHVRIIEQLIATAREIGGSPVVFTFDPHPVQLLRPESVLAPLTWTDRKAELLAHLGVDAMITYPTDEAILALDPQEFFESIVHQQLGARAMVEGPNFHFGRDRAGNIEMLAKLCREVDMLMTVVSPLLEDDEYVSSSRIRRLIECGEVAQANKLLTRPYRIRGRVIRGSERGERIGFPTANLDAVDTLLPAHGVYAGRAVLADKLWSAAINVGPNPTFGEKAFKVETHLLDFQGSLYGQLLEVDFIARLRDIQTFDGIDSLRRQLTRDAKAAREIVPL